MRLFRKISPALLIVIIFSSIISADTSHKEFVVDETIGEKIIHVMPVAKIKNIRKKVSDEVWLQSHLDEYKLIQTAYKELGNVGGEKYWSWYGFDGYVSWCCCFVSWCADQCGLIEKGIIPKFSSVSSGLSYFMSNNQWIWGNSTPKPGMIIFFDYIDSESGYSDGIPDHVGIVKNVKDGYIQCIEGNYYNVCREANYVIGDCNIYGYGTPLYSE